MRIWVVIATVGRAETLCLTLARLRHQQRRADGILVVGASNSDVTGVAEACPEAEIMLAPKGLCKQRNAALDYLADRCDAIVFFDDDFVADNAFLKNVEGLFQKDAGLVGLTGILLGDGAQTGAINFADAERSLDVAAPAETRSEPTTWLYGCNMVIRMSAAKELRFDEVLPLYGWQEDVDFTTQLGRRGTMVRTSALTGIHLGTRGGRQSGLRLGYSQVANIIYLLRKGTIGWRHGVMLMVRNLLANLVRSLWPEPEIDRRGRLAGNIMATTDCLRGRITPQRIETL